MKNESEKVVFVTKPIQHVVSSETNYLHSRYEKQRKGGPVWTNKKGDMHHGAYAQRRSPLLMARTR